MITKKVIIGLINVLENGVLQVRTDTVVEENGVELHRMYHRHVVDVGSDTSNQHEWVQKIAAAIWTSELIKTRKEELEKAQVLFNSGLNQ